MADILHPTDAYRRAVDELTLRDYIALALVPALIAGRTPIHNPAQDAQLAEDAYALADTFLAERASERG